MQQGIKELDAPELAQWLSQQSESVQVIDVREAKETVAGSVPNAVVIPLASLPLHADKIDPDATVVFVCRSGNRSAQACIYMQQRGYENVYNLRGGMIAWVSDSLPTIAPTFNQ